MKRPVAKAKTSTTWPTLLTAGWATTCFGMSQRDHDGIGWWASTAQAP